MEHLDHRFSMLPRHDQGRQRPTCQVVAKDHIGLRLEERRFERVARLTITNIPNMPYPSGRPTPRCSIEGPVDILDWQNATKVGWLARRRIAWTEANRENDVAIALQFLMELQQRAFGSALALT